jgi:ribulose-5-phosphate 4-epimerase/fuculose-1-phosphate aldolase
MTGGKHMDSVAECIRDLAIANRILAREGVVDAFGHVSVRHPSNPERFLLSRSRAPELVTSGDIREFDLTGEPLEDRGERQYGERPIHAAIYEARPDVRAIVHNHSHEVIPFGIAPGLRLRPVAHVCAPIGAEIPVWDIRRSFGHTDLLVLTMEQGRDLARGLGDSTVALMRGHGAVVACPSLKEAVMTAVYLQVNARLQLQVLHEPDLIYLSPEEIERCTKRQFGPLALRKAWDYWVTRAGCESL